MFQIRFVFLDLEPNLDDLMSCMNFSMDGAGSLFGQILWWRKEFAYQVPTNLEFQA